MIKPIKPINIADRIKKLAKGEFNNYPKGTETYHSFVTDKQLRNNEEMCERNKDGSFVLSENETLGLTNEENYIKPYHEELKTKCCRGLFLLTLTQLSNVFRAHGEGISLRQLAFSGDKDLNIDPDPSWGFLMQDYENGYPCINLLPNGKCKYHGDNKPKACVNFPTVGNIPISIKDCSVTFDINGKIDTPCNGCGAF